MKISKVSDVLGTERHVECPKGGFTSSRVVVASDNMGFSVNKTIIPRNGWQHWHYEEHVEACYCIEGRGWIKSLETGELHLIEPDTVYILDKHDDHMFKAETSRVVLISVFNPPLKGTELHDESGSY